MKLIMFSKKQLIYHNIIINNYKIIHAIILI